MPPLTPEAILCHERARARNRQWQWEDLLLREATKLEKAMKRVNDDVTMVDDLERKYYQSTTPTEIDISIKNINDMRYVDEVTTEMAALPTFF